MSATDVAIPLYLETGDVIKVRGDNDEIWIAHIQSVNASTQYCQVHFYVENGNIYRRESSRSDSIHWNTVLGFLKVMWFHNHFIFVVILNRFFDIVYGVGISFHDIGFHMIKTPDIVN